MKKIKRGLLTSDGKVIRGLLDKNGTLYVDLRFTKNPLWKHKTTGERNTQDTRDSWERNLANMKMLSRENKLDEDTLQRFFTKRDVIQSNMPFSKLAEEWAGEDGVLNTLTKKNGTPISSSTKGGYRTAVMSFWLPAFANTSISKITHAMLKEQIAAAKTLLPKTCSNYISALKRLFGYAIDKGYLLASRNPTDGLMSVKMFDQLPMDKAWLWQDVDDLLNKLKEQAFVHYGRDHIAAELMHNYYEWCFFTGERPSEVWAHEIRDIDFNQKKIQVSRSIVQRKLKATKTNKVRSVELHPRAWACLQRQLKLLKKVTIEDKGERQHVFIDGDRQPIQSEKTTSKIWNRVVDRLLPLVTGQGQRQRLRPAYSTRHTSVTLELMMGEHPRDVARQHGHSLQVMETVYTHWSKTNEETRAKIRQLFGYDDLTERRSEKALLAEVVALRAQLARLQGKRQPVAVAA